MVLKIGNVFINEDDLIPAIVKASAEIDTNVKGYHVYKNIWKPTVNEELETKMESENVMDKYAVCVKMNTSMVEHSSKNRKFAKMVFYFLRADQDAECEVVITGKEVNLGDGNRMPVSCKLKIPGPKKWWKFFVKIFNVVQN